MATKLVNAAGLNGKSLSVPDATNITCSLTALSRTLNTTVSLWGRVEAVNGDYYVAQAAPAAIDGTPVTYYSVDGGVNWTVAPEVNDEQNEFCEQIRGPYMGNPAYEYKVQKELPPEEPIPAEQPEVDEEVPEEDADDPEDPEDKEEGEDGADGEGEGDGEDGEKKPEAKKRPKFRILAMAESVRLAHFVNSHDRFCRVIPRGSILELDNGTLTKNRTFQGLSVDAATQLSHYFHLPSKTISTAAAAKAIEENKRLFRDNFNKSTDIFSALSEDMPKGVWAVKHDPGLGVVVLTNLLFHGAMFYHKPGTAEYGQLYFGSGERNLDLCFMLP